MAAATAVLLLVGCAGEPEPEAASSAQAASSPASASTGPSETSPSTSSSSRRTTTTTVTATPGADSPTVSEPSSSTSSASTSLSAPDDPAPDDPAAAESASTGSGDVPTLGLPDMGGDIYGTDGFGVARPSTVYYGGTSSGMVQEITWSTWGGETASGTGTGFYTAPGDIGAESTAETAEILAYDLTTCDGQTAYRHVVWWFPDQGQTYESVMAQRGGDDGYDLCDA